MTELFVLLAPYQHLRLSAMDLLKLAYSLSATASINAEAFEIQLLATASTAHSASLTRYALKCDEHWLDCGRTNDYSSTINVLIEADVRRITQQTPLSLTILSTQQIHLMCMENAHFDHC